MPFCLVSIEANTKSSIRNGLTIINPIDAKKRSKSLFDIINFIIYRLKNFRFKNNKQKKSQGLQ